MCAVSSLPQTVGYYWLSWQSNQLLLVPTAIKLIYYSLLSTVWALRKYCLVNLSSSTFSCTVFLYSYHVFVLWLAGNWASCWLVGRYEALLSVQKLMVHNWEYLGKQLEKPPGGPQVSSLRFQPYSIRRRSHVTCSFGQVVKYHYNAVKTSFLGTFLSKRQSWYICSGNALLL